jgi:hypothetical protein
VDFPWEAGLVEADAKRLGAILGNMEPSLARAAMMYLRLFKPNKTALRLPRAIKLLQEVADLVQAGTVCQDERTGIRRPAYASTWIAGMEQMVNQAERLTLPLTSHGYLRQVVFGLADAADAAAERQREQDRRAGRHLGPEGDREAQRALVELNNALQGLQSDVRLGLLSPEDAEARAAQLRAQYGRQG